MLLLSNGTIATEVRSQCQQDGTWTDEVDPGATCICRKKKCCYRFSGMSSYFICLSGSHCIKPPEPPATSNLMIDGNYWDVNFIEIGQVIRHGLLGFCHYYSHRCYVRIYSLSVHDLRFAYLQSWNFRCKDGMRSVDDVNLGSGILASVTCLDGNTFESPDPWPECKPGMKLDRPMH